MKHLGRRMERKNGGLLSLKENNMIFPKMRVKDHYKKG
jgi:hypothetical protein